MRAVELLMNEHRTIEGVLDALETAATALDQGRTVRPGFFVEAADFISGFADGCHHHKEEGVLFEAIVASGMPATEGPVPVMLQEHEQARALTRGMRHAARRLEEGDMTARHPVVTNALGYVALLRDHIAKEDEVLFPMADQMLSAALHDEVLKGFDRIEQEDMKAGTHDGFLALARRLEKEAALISAR